MQSASKPRRSIARAISLRAVAMGRGHYPGHAHAAAVLERVHAAQSLRE